ncbi:MAG: hypothetical protein P4M11_14345 [Candidatus Pacebacteria bacterium]|nr:hypothetical protein [Candidatus Paceibacterota bacterium]
MIKDATVLCLLILLFFQPALSNFRSADDLEKIAMPNSDTLALLVDSPIATLRLRHRVYQGTLYATSLVQLTGFDRQKMTLNAILQSELPSEGGEGEEREPFGTPRFWMLALCSLGTFHATHRV